MAKKKQHIDDFFKDHLKGSQVPLDGSEWAKLSAELNQKKKRGFFYWLLADSGTGIFGKKRLTAAIAVLLLLTAGTFVISRFLQNNEIGNPQKTEIDPVESTETPKSNDSNETFDTDDSIASIEDANAENEEEATLSENAKSNETTETSTEDKLTDKFTNDVKDKIEKSEVLEKVSETSPSDVNSDDNPLLEKIKELLAGRKSIRLEKQPFEGFRELALPILSGTLVGEHSKVKTKPVAEEIVKKLVQGVELSLDLKPGISTQSLSGNNANYISYRNDNEKAGFGHSMDALVKLNMKNMFVNTGVSYSNYSLNLSEQVSFQLYDSIRVVDINLDTTYIPFNFRDSTISSNAHFNPRYSYAAIPIMIGKDFRLNEKWYLGVSTGLEPKVLLSASGTTNHTSLGLRDINRDNLRKFGLAARADVALNYEVNNLIVLRISAGGKLDAINSIKLSGIDQKFGLTTMGVGLSFKIK